MNISLSSIQRFFLYLTVITAFTGVLAFSFSIGPIHLFPYRFLLLILWAVLVVDILNNNGWLDLSHIRVKRYLLFFALWLAYALLSIIWSVDQVAALKNIIFLFMGISIVFFLVYVIRDLSHLKWLYWLWLLIFISLIPIGIWEVLTGNHLGMSSLLERDKFMMRFAPTTVFTNQNDYAAYIALTMPMILVWIRYYPKLYSRALGFLVLIAGLLLLIMTTARSCYIAVFMGLAFWFIFLLQMKAKIKVLAICILMGLAFADQLQVGLPVVESQMNSLSVVGSQTGEGMSDTIRLNLIKNALYYTIQSVGIGVGAGNAEYYMEHYAIYPVGLIINVHNWWAEILVNYGVLIFTGYVVLYGAIFLHLWLAYKRGINPTEKMLCEALLVGLVSFFMASIASSSIVAFSPQWIYFGFCLAFLNCYRIKNPVSEFINQ